MSWTASITSTREGRLEPIPAGSADGRDQFVVLEDGQVHLLDDHLARLASRELDLTRLLAARGLDRLVALRGADLVILNEQSGTIPDLACDAAAFVADLVLATAPAGERHRLLLIDPVAGEVLDEHFVDAEDAGGYITVHPSEPAAIVEFPMGQDGVTVVSVEITDRVLHVEEILTGQDPVIAGFHPSGTRVLVTPYPSDPDTVRVLSWPALTELARLTAADLDTPIGIGLPACWLDEHSIALYAMEDALVVTDGDLAHPQRVNLPVEFGDNGDLETLVSLAPQRIAAGIWTPAGRRTDVVEFAR